MSVVGYREAGLRFCFRIYRLLVFICSSSIYLSQAFKGSINLNNSLNSDLKNFMNWCTRNYMKRYKLAMIRKVIVPKTKAMVISTRYKVNQIMTSPPTLKIGDETTDISTNEKLLGIHVDHVLSWSTQIEY